MRSVLGRFLEHSRFFVFEAGGRERLLLGSADLIARNLDHRIEVVAPIEGAAMQAELDAVFDALLADNVQAWELHASGKWTRVTPKKGGRRRATHSVLISRARTRARRQANKTE